MAYKENLCSIRHIAGYVFERNTLYMCADALSKWATFKMKFEDSAREEGKNKGKERKAKPQ